MLITLAEMKFALPAMFVSLNYQNFLKQKASYSNQNSFNVTHQIVSPSPISN